MSTPTRLEQLGTLLTAMVAVIVGGSAGVLLDEPVLSRNPVFGNFDIRSIRYGRENYGLVSRVARQLGVGNSAVLGVLHGIRSSARIAEALVREIDSGPSSALRRGGRPRGSGVQRSPIEDRDEFRHGGKYYGTFALVARSLGVWHGTVCAVADGKFQNAEIVRAIKQEQARIDRERPYLSKKVSPLSAEERAHFRRGKKYHCVYRDDAKKLGINPGTVISVGAGKSGNQYILQEIRKQMALRDKTTAEVCE